MPTADDGDFERLVDEIRPEWIDEALVATGTASVRRRRLPAEQVIWLVLGMALYRQRPIADLVDALDLSLPGSGPARVAASAVADARARLGDKPMRWLFERCSRTWGHTSARAHSWRGLAVYGVDGTTVRVPDTPENRTHFGSQSAGADRGVSGYPLARIVTLMALRSHLLVDAQGGPYDSELRYAKALWPQVPENSLVVVDRGFLDAKILLPLVRDRKNRHWLTRAKSTTAYTVQQKLGRGDRVIELKVSSSARKVDPSLPRKFVARAIEYKRRGFQPQTLLTSLLDSDAFPAAEIVALYHERWELELGFDEVKTDLLDRQEAIRSKHPTGVMQELWGVGLAYNLVRLEMQRVAAELGIEPRRISFIFALRAIRDEWMWLAGTGSPGAIPKHLQRLAEDLGQYVLPPRRSKRAYPRAVKIKMSNYLRKRPKVVAS